MCSLPKRLLLICSLVWLATSGVPTSLWTGPALLRSPQVAFAATTDPALQKWRDGYAQDLMKPDGWFALVALSWLHDGDSSVGSAADNSIRLEHVPAHLGVLRQQNGTVEFTASEHVATRGEPAVLLDGKPVTSGTLRADDSAHASVLRTGDVQMTVIRRGDRLYLRVKDPLAPTRLHFRGLAWYPGDPQFRIVAKWVPYLPAKTLKITNVLGQVSDVPSPGYAEFQVEGQTVRLDASSEGEGLFFDFRDTTARSTTDGAGRFLNTGLPDHGVHAPGSVVIDFNYAHNPPCGYTTYATCPLPPAQNRLRVAIPAGEKRYPGA